MSAVETQSSGLSTMAKVGIGVGSFLGIAIIVLITFLIRFCRGNKRQRTIDHIRLFAAPPTAELPPNPASATEFCNRRGLYRYLPFLKPQFEMSNENEIHEMPGHG
jgi:hypothetical protein